MKLDRKLQNKMLHDLYGQYPGGRRVAHFVESENDRYKWQECLFHTYAQLHYLYQHGIISFAVDPTQECRPCDSHFVTITAKGIDFLADDGGLSAVFNTVTVKFDVDNFRTLVEAGLLTANVPEEKQGALKKAIKEAPGTVLQTAVSKMVEKGMSDPVGTAKAVAGLFGISW